MAKRKSGLLKSISLGVILILLQIWIFTQVSEWRSKVMIYILMTAFVFAFGSTTTEKAIFRISFLKAIPKMLLFAGATFGILFVIGKVMGGQAIPTIATALTGVPLSLLLIHGFIVAWDEELLKGWIRDRLRTQRFKEGTIMLFIASVFALLHFATSGGVFLVMLPYFFLGILWYIIGNKYSPTTQVANAGSHWGWNAFILSFSETINKIIR